MKVDYVIWPIIFLAAIHSYVTGHGNGFEIGFVVGLAIGVAIGFIQYHQCRKLKTEG